MKTALTALLFIGLSFPALAQQVDTSLWSSARIARYKEVTKQPLETPMAVLRIPRLRLEAAVFRGSDQDTLDRGLGWVPGTAQPGSAGNTGIAGHRDSFFRPLKDIALDDRIELQTGDTVQTFVVRSLTVVTPSHVEVLAPT